MIVVVALAKSSIPNRWIDGCLNGCILKKTISPTKHLMMMFMKEEKDPLHSARQFLPSLVLLRHWTTRERKMEGVSLLTTVSDRLATELSCDVM